MRSVGHHRDRDPFSLGDMYQLLGVVLSSLELEFGAAIIEQEALEVAEAGIDESRNLAVVSVRPRVPCLPTSCQSTPRRWGSFRWRIYTRK